MSIADNIKELKKETDFNNVTLVAVSKTKPVEDILQAYHAGQRVFGENMVQELVEKQEQLPKDIEWHLIGHLQTNKVKYIAPFISLIQAVDSLKLLQEINKQENKDGTGGLGNLDKISKEMEQTENDIVNRRITDEVLKRQQQIQTRMLEAEKAEQQREQDQQRESNAGKDMPPGYIKALQDYQKTKEKQTEQIKTVSPALNLYYKQKIKSYFDQLNAK